MVTLTENQSTVNERQAEALSRAITGQSWSNFPAIIQGFKTRGIPEENILPRENVFTYAAWKALGRQVRKGEHGIKIHTFIPITKEVEKDGEKEVKTYSRPRTTTVFHVSQTEAVS